MKSFVAFFMAAALVTPAFAQNMTLQEMQKKHSATAVKLAGNPAILHTGKPLTLADKQLIQEFVADSYVELLQFRLTVLHAAWLIDTQGERAGPSHERSGDRPDHGAQATGRTPTGQSTTPAPSRRYDSWLSSGASTSLLRA